LGGGGCQIPTEGERNLPPGIFTPSGESSNVAPYMYGETVRWTYQNVSNTSFYGEEIDCLWGMSYTHIEHHPECALRRTIERTGLGCPTCISFHPAGLHSLVVTSVPMKLGNAVLSWVDVYCCIDSDCDGVWVRKRPGHASHGNWTQHGMDKMARERMHRDCANAQNLAKTPCTCAEVRE